MIFRREIHSKVPHFVPLELKEDSNDLPEVAFLSSEKEGDEHDIASIPKYIEDVMQRVLKFLSLLPIHMALLCDPLPFLRHFSRRTPDSRPSTSFQIHSQRRALSRVSLIPSLFNCVPSFMSVWSSWILLHSRECNTWEGYMKEFNVRMDEQMAREQPTKKMALHNFISSTSLTLVALVILRFISWLVTLVILRLSSRLVA